jgi:hypothetical protein
MSMNDFVGCVRIPMSHANVRAQGGKILDPQWYTLGDTEGEILVGVDIVENGAFAISCRFTSCTALYSVVQRCMLCVTPIYTRYIHLYTPHVHDMYTIHTPNAPAYILYSPICTPPYAPIYAR